MGKQAKMIKQRKNAGTKRKNQHKKYITIQLEINQKVLAKEGRLINISTKGKTIQTKQNIPKQRKKILQTNLGR